MAPEIVRESCRAKGLRFDRPAAAEEWLGGPVPVVRSLRLLVETLTDIETRGKPRVGRCATAPNGALSVEVFPRDRFDTVMYPGVRVQVWMQPDVTAANLGDTMAVAYRNRETAGGRVSLVLAAGNVSSIGPMDLLTKLVVENQVVVLKTHPINSYLGPLIGRAFEPLVGAGFLQVVAGDAAEGAYLVHHPAVDDVHITGSAAAHDRIVWGDTLDEQATRRAARTPKLTKRITSELGCVTPVIIVPGDWARKEIDYQAENVATMVAHNASCNCNAAKLLVTWSGWNRRREFLDRIESILAALPQKTAYYPGSAAKYAACIEGRPGVKRVGIDAGPGTLPYATVFGVDYERNDDPVFCHEAWSPVIAETALPATDAAAFLDAAARFCNDRVSGTLSAVVLIDPRTHARLGAAVDRTLAELRYGTVAVNHWSAMSYALAAPPWGAFPGHTLEDVGSGIGFVHNTSMFDRPLKTVLRGPFTTTPKPAWFATHRRAHIVAEQMVRFEASPAWWRLPRIAFAAMQAT